MTRPFEEWCRNRTLSAANEARLDTAVEWLYDMMHTAKSANAQVIVFDLLHEVARLRRENEELRKC